MLKPDELLGIVAKDFKKEDSPKNTAVVLSNLAIHKDFMKEGLAYLLLGNLTFKLLSYGFKEIKVISSSPLAKRVGLRFKSKIFKEL